MTEKTRYEAALSDFVLSAGEEAVDVAGGLEAMTARLEKLADVCAPVDRKFTETVRSAAASIRQHSPDLRKAAQDFEGKMLPGEPEPDVVPIERAREA